MFFNHLHFLPHFCFVFLSSFGWTRTEGAHNKSRMPDGWRALDQKVNHSTFSRRRGESTHPALQDSVARLPSLPDISDSEGLWTEGMSPLDTWCSASSDGESEHQHVSAHRIPISLLFCEFAAQTVAVWVAIAL